MGAAPTLERQVAPADPIGLGPIPGLSPGDAAMILSALLRRVQNFREPPFITAIGGWDVVMRVWDRMLKLGLVEPIGGEGAAAKYRLTEAGERTLQAIRGVS